MITKLDLMVYLEECVNDYRLGANFSINRNRHMNKASGEDLRQEDIDALLVDFVNYIGNAQGIDYGLYTKDLARNKK